jgi:hypothetical protein
MLAFCMIILSTIAVSAVCKLDASLINQDPYPAIPGDYVKLIFQLSGADNPECRKVFFELSDNYPIIFDPGESPRVEVFGGTFRRDFSSNLVFPYKVRVDEDALDGDNNIEAAYGLVGSNSSTLETFQLEVDDSRADFELHIDKYSSTTREITIEILNIGENDVEALTIEIPKQDNIRIIGSNRAIVGDLDSSEFTTADFKGVLSDGEIKVKVYYTDSISSRREIEKSIIFDSSYFVSAGEDDRNIPTIYIVIGIVVIIILVFWFFRRKKHKERRKG